MGVAAICAVVCYLKIPETNQVDISSEASVANLQAGGTGNMSGK